MSTYRFVRAIAIVAMSALLWAPAATRAGDSLSEFTVGANFFSASPACPVRDMPTFEALAPVPGIFATGLFAAAEFTCFVDVTKGDNDRGVKKARGAWKTEVIIRDNNTGMLETFPIDSGRIKTDSNGQDDFDFEIPSPLFADGFESGDVSAWSYTRVTFDNKKKANDATVQCFKTASRSRE